MTEIPETTPPSAEQPLCNQTKWRRDFPVDEPQDQYIARRDFTKFLVLISGAFTFGQFCIAFRSLYRAKTRSGFPRLRIASVEEIPVGSSRIFHYPTENESCLLVRVENDEFVAYSNKCTHLMCPVIPKVSERRFFCPCHQGHFDMMSGRVLAGPPPRPLPKVQLEIKDGVVFATGMERAST